MVCEDARFDVPCEAVLLGLGIIVGSVVPIEVLHARVDHVLDPLLHLIWPNPKLVPLEYPVGYDCPKEVSALRFVTSRSRSRIMALRELLLINPRRVIVLRFAIRFVAIASVALY